MRPSPPMAGWLAPGLAMMLIAFNLRPALTQLGPLLPEIMRDTGLSATVAGSLTTLPVLCLGVFGLAAPALGRTVGVERTVVAALGLIVTGLALRGAAATDLLFAGSLLAGVGIGVANVMMPAILKRYFGDRPALTTGAYTCALCLGAAIASAGAVPLAVMFGGSWRYALAVWAVPAALALGVAAWFWRYRLFGRAGAPAIAERPVPIASLLMNSLAWQVTLFMGCQSLLAYATFGWLAPILRSRGDSAHVAGLVVGVSLTAQMVGSLLAPALASRLRHQGAANAVSVLVVGASFLALAEAPLAWQWPIAIFLGLASGGALALAIMLMVLRAADSRTAAALSGMAQGIGYTLAASGPFLIGLLHGLTGDWRGAEAVFIMASLIAAAAGALAGRPRLVRLATLPVCA